jgi:hypothetical protein
MYRAIQIALPAVAMLALAACEPAKPARLAYCEPANYQTWVGKNIGEIDYPHDRTHRVITPDSVVTQEFSPFRVNIHVDAKGWISKVSCG